MEGNREEPSLAADTGRARQRRQHNRKHRNQARHEDRRDRGEPSWHGDSRERWHQPRPLPGRRPESETGQVDPLMINDPWATNSTPLRASSIQALQKVGERSARVERRIRRRHVSSSGSNSSASESSSSSSSSSTRSRRRRRDKKKKVDHSRNVKIPTFDGIQSHYKEYRRAVKRYTKLVGKEGTGLALQLNLSGEALEITRTLSAGRLREKGGGASLDLNLG